MPLRAPSCPGDALHINVLGGTSALLEKGAVIIPGFGGKQDRQVWAGPDPLSDVREFTVMVPPGPGEWLSSVGILPGGHRTP